MFKLVSACAAVVGGTYFVNSRQHFADIDFDIYDKLYNGMKNHFVNLSFYLLEKLDISDLGDLQIQYALTMTQKLMGINMMYTINRDQYQESLCGEIDGIFLPNIIGLEEGYDCNARQLDSLFGIGFGFVEAGSVSESPVYGGIDSMKEGTLLMGKANLKSFKKKQFGGNSHRFPLGVSLKVGQEVREMIPTLAESDLVAGCEELIEVVDYFVVNLTDSDSLHYLLKKDKLSSLLKQLKEKRAYSIGVSALLQHEKYSLAAQGNKRDVNSVYAAEILGSEFSSLQSEAFVPKIYVKVDEEQHSLPVILEIAKSHKELGLEGLVIRTNNLSTIQRIAVLTQGKIPLIVAGTTPTGIDIINRVKSGAWAIQLGVDFQEKGPKVVENLLQEVRSELKRQNVRNITELRGVNVN